MILILVVINKIKKEYEMFKTKNKILLYLLFGCYCALMIYLLFLQRDYAVSASLKEHIKNSVNVIPFHSIHQFIYIINHYGITSDLTRFAIINLVGNIIMFMPLGYFLVVIFHKQRNIFYFFMTCFLIIGSIEILQLLTMVGSFDVDDVILNMVGCLIGYFFSFIHKRNQHGY